MFREQFDIFYSQDLSCDSPIPPEEKMLMPRKVLKEGAISGKASSTEIGVAAFTMLQTCVVERGVGGMAFNIGEFSKVRQP